MRIDRDKDKDFSSLVILRVFLFFLILFNVNASCIQNEASAWPFLLLNSFVIKLMGKEKRRKRPGPHHFCFGELPSAYLGLMVRF